MAEIFQEIKADHARDLMRRIMDASNQARKQREKLFEAFKLDMGSHYKIEEDLLYQPLREAMEALNEHHVVGGLIEELDAMPKNSDAWIGKFSALKEHHMDEEETEIFSDARNVTKEDRAEEPGDKFQGRKNVVVPALTPEH